MTLGALRDLLVAGGLRIQAGRLDAGDLVVDLEADRPGGGGIWTGEMPVGHEWQIEWQIVWTTGGADGRRGGMAYIDGPGWRMRLPVADEPGR